MLSDQPDGKQTRGKLGFRVTKEWVLVADVFKAHWTDAVKKIISDNNGKMVPVPINMTSYLQPLDLTVNRSCKAFLRNQAQIWCSQQVQSETEKGIQPDKVSVDSRISVLTPIPAKCLVQLYAIEHRNRVLETIGGITAKRRPIRTVNGLLNLNQDKNRGNCNCRYLNHTISFCSCRYLKLVLCHYLIKF